MMSLPSCTAPLDGANLQHACIWGMQLCTLCPGLLELDKKHEPHSGEEIACTFDVNLQMQCIAFPGIKQVQQGSKSTRAEVRRKSCPIAGAIQGCRPSPGGHSQDTGTELRHECDQGADQAPSEALREGRQHLWH